MGIAYVPSSVNYYLLKMDNAGAVVSGLTAQGILIRDCSNFIGLGEGYVRIAVRRRKENKRLLTAMSAIMQQKMRMRIM